MSGILTALPGVLTPPVVYVDGWYGPFGQDLSPIQASATGSFGGSVGTYTWVGYLRVPSSGSYTVSINTTYSENGTAGSSSTGQFWIGNNAITPTGGANINTNNSTGNFVTSLAQDVYTPCRFVWNFDLRYNFFQGTGAFGFASFSLNSSTDVSGLIFYNSITNGF